MKKPIIVSAVLAASLAALAFYIHFNSYSVYGNSVRKVHLDGKVLRVEVVDTPEKMRLGLGERSGICEGCGMLFVFPEKDRHSFWMKGMEFPLDILWLMDERVVAIEKDIPYDSKEIFSPDVISDHVLELNAGMAGKLDVGIGSKLEF